MDICIIYTDRMGVHKCRVHLGAIFGPKKFWHRMSTATQGNCPAADGDSAVPRRNVYGRVDLFTAKNNQ